MHWTRLFFVVLVLGFVLVVTPAFGDVIVDGSDGQADLGPPDCSGISPADTSIQQAVTSTSSGDTVWVCPHTYDEVITVDTPNVTVRSAPSGDSTNVVVRAPNAAGLLGIPVLTFFRDNARVIGMRFRNGWEGVRFQGVTGGLLRDTRADSNVTDGVFLFDGTSGVSVTRSRMDANDLSGVNVRGADSNTIVSNQVSGNGREGIRLLDAAENRVVDNRVAGNTPHGIALHDTTVRNQIEDNHVEGNAFDGIFSTGAAAGSNDLIGNRSVLNGRHGLALDAVDSSTVQSNVADTNTVHGLSVTGGSGHLVESNRVRGNGAHGVSMTSSTGNDIRRNTLHSNGNAGLHLDGSTNNSIVENVLRDGVGTNNPGVVMTGGSDGNSLNGNRIERHDSAGVKVFSSASNTLRDNVVDTNTFGVWLHNADDHRLESNRIRDNDTGIVVSGTASDSEISNVAQLNIIAGNGQGIVNSTVRIFDARRVFWGASSGPSGGNTDPFSGAVASGAGDEIASPGVPDTNVAFSPFLSSTNLPGGGGAGTAEECLIQRMDPPSAAIEGIRSLRDGLMESRFGRWITQGYYRASAGLVSSGFPGSPLAPDRPR